MTEWIRKLYSRLQETWNHPAYRRWKKVIIAMFGSTVLLIGIAMIVLPGPALVVIPLGLAVLGTEFVWAKKLHRRIQDQVSRMRSAFPGFGARGGSNEHRQKQERQP